PINIFLSPPEVRRLGSTNDGRKRGSRPIRLSHRSFSATLKVYGAACVRGVMPPGRRSCPGTEDTFNSYSRHARPRLRPRLSPSWSPRWLPRADSPRPRAESIDASLPQGALTSRLCHSRRGIGRITASTTPFVKHYQPRRTAYQRIRPMAAPVTHSD